MSYAGDITPEEAWKLLTENPAILAFQGSWNNFTGPLLFLQRPEMMTLTVGMNFFRTQFSNDLSAILVGAMFNAIPVLVLFFILNRYFLESASYSGLAGQ